MSDVPTPQSGAPVAVVTGGNRGLGLETCRQLARRGLEVVLTARDPEQGARAAAALAEAGLAVRFHPLDVTDDESIALLDRFVGREVGRLDALVNNAGVSLKGFDAEVVRSTLAVNYDGAVAITDRLLPRLSARARVVMVSSGLGDLSCLGPSLRPRFLDDELTREGLRELLDDFLASAEAGAHRARGWPSSAYSVSKVALNAYTRLLARELRAAKPGVAVNAVCPGWVRTDMGGTAAPLNVAQGADTIVWAATLPPGGPSGKLFRERQPIGW